MLQEMRRRRPPDTPYGHTQQLQMQLRAKTRISKVRLAAGGVMRAPGTSGVARGMTPVAVPLQRAAVVGLTASALPPWHGSCTIHANTLPHTLSQSCPARSLLSCPQAQRLLIARMRPPLAAAPSVWRRRETPVGRIDFGGWPRAEHWEVAAKCERPFWAASRLVPCYGGLKGSLGSKPALHVLEELGEVTGEQAAAGCIGDMAAWMWGMGSLSRAGAGRADAPGCTGPHQHPALVITAMPAPQP